MKNTPRRRGTTLAAAVAMAAVIGVAGSNPALAGESIRLGGSDRIETGLKVYEANRAVFTSDTVVLAGTGGFADALTAAPLAAAYRAPVLTTRPDDLDARVLASLQTQGVKRVVVIGGEGAVSAKTAAALTASGLGLERIGGADRYETARLIAAKVMQIKGVDSIPVFVADGSGYADALAAGPAVAQQGGVILLSRGTTLDAQTAGFIKAKASSVTAVGGAAAKAVDATGVTATKIVGADRYATAALIASKFFVTPKRVVVASGADYGDAVSGSAFAALTGSPLLLTQPRELPAVTATYLSDKKPNLAFLGGTGAISAEVARRAAAFADGGGTGTEPTPFPTPVATPTNPADGGTTTPAEKPTITQQPMDRTVEEGSAVTFLTVATGATTYQWAKSTDNGSRWADLPGATQPTLSFTPSVVDSGTQYRIVVQGPGGTATSSAVKLTVQVPAVVKTSLSFDPPTNAVKGTIYSIPGTLIDVMGRPVSGAEVTVTWESGNQAKVQTASDGSFTAQLRAPAWGTIVASFGGTSRYTSAESFKSVTVTAAATVAATDGLTPQGGPFTGTVVQGQQLRVTGPTGFAGKKGDLTLELNAGGLSGVSMDLSTGGLSGIISAAPGIYTLQVTATDSGDGDKVTYPVTVTVTAA